MMKGIFSAIVLTMIAFLTNAQCRVEVMAGPNLSGFWGRYAFEDPYKPKLDFTAGIGATLGLRREGRFVQMQLLYERKGARYDFSYYRFIDERDPMIREGGRYATRRDNYLTMPMMYGFEKGKRVRFTFSFGPYVGVLLGSSSIYDGEKVKYDTNGWDVGLSGAIGLYVPVTARGDLKIAVQDNFGLLTDGDWDFLKNNSLSLQVGYCYKLKD